MSVYIKGMEMPKDCGHCRFAVDGWCYAYGKPNIDALANEGRTNFCPLIPVPPHGKLIEAEPIVKYITDGLNSGEFGYDTIKVMAEVEYAPTIIPAEEEVYDKYVDTAGNLHWTGTHSGKHILKAEEGE